MIALITALKLFFIPATLEPTFEEVQRACAVLERAGAGCEIEMADPDENEVTFDDSGQCGEKNEERFCDV